jgi:hypothetical protein
LGRKEQFLLCDTLVVVWLEDRQGMTTVSNADDFGQFGSGYGIVRNCFSVGTQYAWVPQSSLEQPPAPFHLPAYLATFFKIRDGLPIFRPFGDFLSHFL